MMQFVQELRRRKVVQTLVYYLGIGWVIIGAGDILFPIWRLPENTLTLVILVVISGIPVVAIGAWFLDLVPNQSAAQSNRGPADLVLIALLSGALIISIGLNLLDRESQPKDGSVVVLPFQNLSSEQADYLAAGLSEELRLSLSRLPGLKVIGRVSSLAASANAFDLAQLRNQLGVSYVVEGTVRAFADRVRVISRLVDAQSGRELASMDIDEPPEDLFRIQRDIAARISSALQPQLVGDELNAALNAGTESAEAYRHFYVGRKVFEKDTLASAIESQQHFEAAIQIDPFFTLAHGALMRATVAEVFRAGQFESLPQRMNKVLDRINTILPEQDPGRRLANVQTAAILDRDVLAAQQEYLDLIRERPDEGAHYYWFAVFLGNAGVIRPAIDYLDIALSTDPLNPDYIERKAVYLQALGENELAISQFDRCLELAPIRPGCHVQRAQVLAAMGRLEDALQSVSSFASPELLCVLKAFAGEPCPTPTYNTSVMAQAFLAAHAGNLDLAFDYYFKGADQPYSFVDQIRWQLVPPESVTTDPRYKELLEKLGLTDELRLRSCEMARTLKLETGVLVDCEPYSSERVSEQA